MTWKQEETFFYSSDFKRKKKFFTIHSKTKSVFPVEGGNIGSDFSEIRQHASLQRNRENQVVSPRSQKTDDTVL